MARDMLSCLEKRDLLNQPVASVEAMLRWGRQYEEEGLVYDAVSFYDKANARDDLERLKETAREEGDAFLLGRICRTLGDEPTPEEWLALAERAEVLGKQAYAAQARARADSTAQ